MVRNEAGNNEKLKNRGLDTRKSSDQRGSSQSFLAFLIWDVLLGNRDGIS